MNYNRSKHTFLDWYPEWPMMKYEIPPDGHCLFHALCMAFFKPYLLENFNGHPMSRRQIVYNIRKELSEKLAQPVNGKNGETYYDLLNNGQTALFAKEVPEFTLQHMQAELNSNAFIGYGYLEYISNQINKDIIILDANTKKIYVSDEKIIKGRYTIVLYYENNHFELIGFNHKTHFKPNHPFILFLKEL
jgi:hypothetical protein